MRQLTALLMLAVASSGNAEGIYQTTDKHGNPVFSDQASQGARPVEIQPTNTVTIPRTPLPERQAPATAVAGYEQVSITTPSHDAVFHNDPAPITITGISKPALHPGHQYRFVINGQPTPPSATPYYEFPTPPRGTYTVLLEIIDARQQVIAGSNPISFHVKRHSILFPKPVAPAAGKP